MAGSWTVGAVFAIAVLIFCVPIGVGSMIWFWSRRNLQPIKARAPPLVILTDFILVLYLILLCVQRIASDSYPCLLTLWSGYIGTIVLFNTYLWRCWTLYFTFNLTQQKLLNLPLSQLPFFIRKRHFVSSPFLFKLFGSLTVALLVPCGILTATSPSIGSQVGDGCNKGWGDPLLAAYVFVYVACFLTFSFQMRHIADGFYIKEELKFTGITGAVALIPWYIFNQIGQSINQNIFPFSTACLLVAVCAAFAASTIFPLYRSIFHVDDTFSDDQYDTPNSLTNLYGIISTPSGLDAFTKFLSKEFSVENILFFQEIEEFRKMKIREQGSVDGALKVLGEARRIYAKYIITDAPFQVNLPDVIVKNLESVLKNEFANANKTMSQQDENQDQNEEFLNDQNDNLLQAIPAVGHEFLNHEVPTIFDAAQRNIYMLMETDSCPRFFRSDLYKDYHNEVAKKHHTKEVLQEMNII